MSTLPHEASAVIPSGTVTFAFTDIEGSTQRWDRDRSAMQDAVRRHDSLMRAAIAAYRGHVFKTIGDAFCSAFGKPEDAVAAMFEAQRKLAEEDFSAIGGLRVRAAIHSGTADERDRDYFGPAVNRVARLLAITYGGQVLLSGVTTELVQGSLPPQVSLRDLGEHRLRDLSRPEHVYQLLAPNLIADFPPLKSLGAQPNNLPRYLTSFVGRAEEIAEITSLIAEHRLVTLVGSGGIGKTRASLQVAANLLDGWSDGVWFAELAPLSRGEYIPSIVAQAMGLTLASEGDPTLNLVRVLASKRALLVFDNCEHLVEESAKLVSAILNRCPDIRVLASSRQALGIAGERTYRMPSLELPSVADAAALTAHGAKRYAALALFVDRASASDNRFQLTDDDAPIVGDICRRLDGIALAIELAAARVKILSPKQLHDRLDERFRLLCAGRRDALPRQQTLRALIDWSHDLLDERERALFRRAAVFVNGFTLEGAVAVGSGENLDEFDVLDVIASLVDKSLVLAEPGGDALRYRLLESTRAYAAEKLAEAAEREVLANKHLRYFRDLFAGINRDEEQTTRLGGGIRTFATELDDLRCALDRASAGPGLQTGAELLVAIGFRWGTLGLRREGIARIEQYAAALPEGETLVFARLRGIMSGLLIASGHFGPALENARRSLGHARNAGDAATLAFALLRYGSAQMKVGNFAEADAALCEAESLPDGTPRMRSRLLETRAYLSRETGNLDAAARALEQLRERDRALGNLLNEFQSTLELADIEFRRGEAPRAIGMLRELLPALRSRSGDKELLSEVLMNFAAYLAATGDLAAAVEAAGECVGILAPSEPDHVVVSCALEIFALGLALRGSPQRAATLAGYADAALARAGYAEFAVQTVRDCLSGVLRERLSPEDHARLTAGGAALAPETALTLALADASERALP